ncbi:MAG: hypothetical protein ABI488_22930 [Polyangiaceae bacterium]
MSGKLRLSASVDAAMIAAAQAAVASGLAANVSEWVNEAMRRQAEHDQRLRAFDEFLLDYETKHGVITEAEIRNADRRARARATVVRGSTRGSSPGPKRARSSGAR